MLKFQKIIYDHRTYISSSIEFVVNRLDEDETMQENLSYGRISNIFTAYGIAKVLDDNPKIKIPYKVANSISKALDTYATYCDIAHVDAMKALELSREISDAVHKHTLKQLAF